MHASLTRIALALPPVLVAAALATSIARAQATIGDCERIEAADAYNQCLAKFGPEKKSQNLEPERPGDVKNSAEEAAAGAGRPGGSGRMRAGRHGSRNAAGGGRHRLVFSVRRRRR